MNNLYKSIAEKDQRNIEELKHRIELANLLVNEVDDLIFSGKQITQLEWRALKKKANRNKTFLLKVHKDPKVKIFLHLQENQELETSLSKQLDRSLVDALDRLTVSINVIDDEIKDTKQVNNRHELFVTLEKACIGMAQYNSLLNWFIKKKFCDQDTFRWDKEKYTLASLAQYLKDLYRKGYSERELELKEIQLIITNSFKSSISMDTVKHAKRIETQVPRFMSIR